MAKLEATPRSPTRLAAPIAHLATVTALALTFALGTLPAPAQEAAATESSEERQRFPCRHGEEYRAFDFWIGSWDVYDPRGKKVGTNTIESAADGCMLFESWQSAGGGGGHSVNYLDPATGEWVQVWVGSNGEPITARGGVVDGSMVLVGEHVLRNGEKRAFRMTFTPRADGGVRQFLEESTDGGESWGVWFDGLYLPAGSEPPAAEPE